MASSSDDVSQAAQAEKQAGTPTNDISDNSHSSKWQATEEKSATRKVDTSVLPLLFLGLLVFQLDRMNLASALTGGLREDIDIDQSTVNLGEC